MTDYTRRRDPGKKPEIPPATTEILIYELMEEEKRELVGSTFVF
jgi:hypothetical protein